MVLSPSAICSNLSYHLGPCFSCSVLNFSRTFQFPEPLLRLSNPPRSGPTSIIIPAASFANKRNSTFFHSFFRREDCRIRFSAKKGAEPEFRTFLCIISSSVPRHLSFYFTATASISIRTSFGSLATSTQDLAGQAPSKYSA